MNSFLIVSIQFIVVFLLIVILKVVNYDKEERYNQVWVPFAATIFVWLLLLLESYISSFITSIVSSIAPSLLDFVVVLMNVLFLIGFLLVKVSGKALVTRWKKSDSSQGFKAKITTTWNRVVPEKWQENHREERKTISFVYEKVVDRVALKPEWAFGYYLALFCSTIPLVFFLIIIVHSVFPIVSLAYVPTYPILSFILLIEIAWFFGGTLLELKDGTIVGKNATPKKQSAYQQLYEQYIEQFTEQIVTRKQVSNEQRDDSYAIRHYHKNHPYSQLVMDIAQQLQHQGKTLQVDHLHVLSELLQGRHLLLKNPNYADLFPVLLAGIHQQLMNGKKMIIIASDEIEAKAVKQWFQEGFKREAEGFQYIWKIETFELALKQNIPVDLLIVTPPQLLQASLMNYLLHDVDVTRYEMVLMVDAAKILFNYHTVLHAFIWKLEDYLQAMPQQIILSEWYEGLHEEVQHVLRIQFEPIAVKLPMAINLFYIVWKEEGATSLQGNILPKLTHRKLDTEAMITLPALKYGVVEMYIGNQQDTVTKESLQELMDNTASLQEYGITPKSIDLFRDIIHFMKSPILFDRGNNRFLIVRDFKRNFINTLSKWWSSGKENTFVHIVSPPYLLRDYLAANQSFFLENTEKVSPILPELPETRWSMAYLLIERLMYTAMLEEEILSYLESVTGYVTSKPMVEQLNEFLQDALQTKEDFLPYLEIVEKEQFSIEQVNFETLVYYKFSKRLYNVIVSEAFEFYQLKTRTNEVIGSIPANNIYQHFLPGQKHVLNGTLYTIERINSYTKTIELDYEAQTEKYTYHQNRTFQHDPKQEGVVRKTLMINQQELTFSMLKGKMDVVINGYFHFDHGIDLLDEKLKYTKLSYREQELYDRHYSTGSMVQLEWKVHNGSFKNVDYVAFTLAFLLNELFVSVFPYGHKYVAVTTVLPDDFFPIDDMFSMNLKRYFPKVKVGEKNTADTLYLYIYEDTNRHLGLLERIIDKWQHLLEIVEDYMYWFLQEQIQEVTPTFLYLGREELPTQFDFPNTMAAIQALLPTNRLRTQREKYLLRNQVVETESTEKKRCDFCREEFPAAEFIVLDDGRERCMSCHQSSIDHVDELKPLYERVRQFFIEDLNIELRSDIHINMVNAKEIQELSGHEFVATEDYDARIVGKAIKQGGVTEIYIENGAPYLQTLTTLVHELTHIWQFDHVHLEYISTQTLEGHASWMEVYFLKTIKADKEADRLHGELMKREDVYGEGYREILAALEKYPEGSTPFDLYRVRSTVT